MKRALLVVLLLASCSGAGDVVHARVRVEGLSVWIDGDAPLRGVQLELAWDPGVHVSAIEAGAGSAHLDLVRAHLADDGRSARVIVADTRQLALPGQGELVHVVAEGEGALRVVSAIGVGAGGHGRAELVVEAAP